jgi:hypothetical protein
MRATGSRGTLSSPALPNVRVALAIRIGRRPRPGRRPLCCGIRRRPGAEAPACLETLLRGVSHSIEGNQSIAGRTGHEMAGGSEHARREER